MTHTLYRLDPTRPDCLGEAVPEGATLDQGEEYVLRPVHAPRATPLDMPPQRPALAPTTPAQLRQIGEALHRALELAVRRLRLEGGSWADVGHALGVTRQAAHQRWRYVDELPDRVELRVKRQADGTRRASAWSRALGMELSRDGSGRVEASSALRAIAAT